MKFHKSPIPVLALIVSGMCQMQGQSFTDMSAPSGFNTTGQNHGVAIGDFNQDGWDDIYVSRLDGPNLLYVNHGNFQLTEEGEAYGVDYSGSTVCAVWFDMDGDKDLDLFLGNRFIDNLLYRNDGDHFTDVSDAYDIRTLGNVHSVNAVDYDNDGDMDIYVAQVFQQNLLWRNEDTVFTNVIDASGIDDTGRSLGAVFFDYDNDGDQDLYQTQDGFDQNLMYRNNGDGTFTDVSLETGLDFAGYGMGAAVGDLNADGYADVYITNLDSNRLYISDGLGHYNEISTSAGVADIGMGWSTFMFDCDNDGLEDIYLSNDSYFGIVGHGKLRNRLFVNQGNMAFYSQDTTADVQNEFGSYGAACADFDKDGKMDVIIANDSPVDGNQLFRNVGATGNYITFELEGVMSNTQAIGSRVVLYSGNSIWTDYVVAGSGYASQSSAAAHFGIGSKTAIDSVVIYWPSGLRQKSSHLDVNKRYHVVEGKSLLATGKVVWTEPAFPTKYDDVTVYFDASEGNAALEGYQGDVFAHTGVITSESVNGNDWKHVIGNWGTADGRVLMTREEENIYSLSYNITDFYGIPAGEEVLKMAFVFRNINGTIVGRDTDGSDIFTDVYPPNSGLLLDVRSPFGPDVMVKELTDLTIDIAASDTVDLKIYDNGDLILSAVVQDTTFQYMTSVPGLHVLHFEGTRDTTVITVDREFYVYQEVPSVALDPGLKYGINYTDDDYIFRLYAPNKDYAFVLCPANNYQPNADFQMFREEGEDGFVLSVPRSAFTGNDNTYQYLVSNGIRVADPFSKVVLDAYNDQWIDADVMATLPPYPTGMATGIVTAFDGDDVPYDFQVQDFQRPDKSKLVIYELLVRDFLTDHRYKTLKDTLAYFEKLGVNAIELMPVSEFEGNVSWGYNVSFQGALDKYYGTRNELKEFIDAAHARGIAVIFDVVFNHVFSQSPLAQMYWDAANFRPAPENPYLNVIPRHPFNVGYDVNHESPATKAWVKQVLSYWLTEFKVDGFRFDLSKGFTQFNSGNDAGLMAQYDPGRIAILEDYADQVWSVDSNAYVILEHFADNSEEQVLSSYGMMLWGNLNYQFAQAAKGYQSDLEWLDYTVRDWTGPNLVGYMESHDEERMIYRLETEGDHEGDYDTRELTTALQRAELASAIFYSVPGPKMLYEFGELGYDFPINYCVNGTINNNCRLDPKPIRWDYLTDYRREHLRKVISALLYLKTTSPTFSTKDFVFNDGNYYLKTVHLNDPDMDAVVLANFRVINSDLNPKFQYPGTWYEYFTGDSIVVTNTQEKLPFGPGEYRLYTSKRLMPPEGFISSTHDLQVTDLEVFPNPIAGGETAFCKLPSNADVKSVSVYDVAGSISTTCYFEVQDGMLGLLVPNQLVSGIYVIGIQTAEEYLVGKLMVQ